MTLNKMKLRRLSPSVVFPPTIKAFFAVDEGLKISPNSLKTWWPGTELNRRRQPFQGCALPPELPGHVSRSTYPRPSTRIVRFTPIVEGLPTGEQLKRQMHETLLIIAKVGV